MKILDTDFLIAVLNKETSLDKIKELESEAIATTIFNKQEILFGIFSEEKKEDYDSTKQLLDSLPTVGYDDESMMYAVKSSVYLRKRGSPIGVIDEMIAGICLRHSVPIVTRNTRHFARIPGLKVESW
ncbi:MAG: type II toxin-antitoxin system VapC family toxin [Candidatus Aenigmarchaeota archaeon]|nr:type II toxin-antitoxin system VapC family toxin [Candidatus Aenigmarchaeota archaeon]